MDPLHATERRDPSRRPVTSRGLLALLLAVLLAMAGSLMTVGPAAATTVYEIDGRWVSPPPTISRGNPVTAEWRINVNDDRPAPSNDPIDNVTATFTVEKAFFDQIPDMCKTTGVTPASSLSADKTQLTCNFGPVVEGTAIVLQAPVVANGTTGEFVTMSGTSPSGETKDLSPIRIVNPFAMDIQWAATSDYEKWDDPYDPHYVDVDLEWSLRMGNGSDPGPDSVTYRLNLATQDGSPIQVGLHPSGVGEASNAGVRGCTSHDLGPATGHPYSNRPGVNEGQGNFVASCTLTAVAGVPGAFDLTLSGINYDLTNAPSLDSFSNPLPTNWDYVASGMIWLRVLTDQSGSIRLTSNAPTYAAPTGQRYTDLAGNNTSSKAYTLPGSWSAAWYRPYTRSGGTSWDDTYKLPAGTETMQYVNVVFGADSVPATAQYGNCLTFDTQFVTYVEPDPMAYPQVRGLIAGGGAGNGAEPANPPTIQYHTGGVGDPNAFDCFSSDAGWSTTKPASLASVTAIRIVYPHSYYGTAGFDGLQLVGYTQIKPGVPVGQDVWMFGSALRNGVTYGPGAPWDTTNVVTPTDDARYPFTNGRRDILRIVLATPHITKKAAQLTIRPGEPMDFTLTYSATGTVVPATVDDYRIVDTLPAGMSYVADSASPAPQVSTDGQGRQVLTWRLDGVTTNVNHPLTYQAVADPSVAPGTPLTNTATATLANAEASAAATVTTTTNGYTRISKSADTPFIPNLDGQGNGEGVWTVSVRSFDPLPQAFTDTIDILPFRGDARGTDYEGDYSLVDVTPIPGAQVFYTTADPVTLSDDPANPMNGSAAGNPVGNTVGWTPVFTPDATAVRVIGPRLGPGAEQQFKVRIATTGADGEDVFVNRAQGRAGHTELVMRTSSPMTVANYYSAALKKYVQDRAGKWHDANDAADYPVFNYGDTVRYRIVVTNTGQGTLTNLVVTDDKQPQAGGFTVASLAPGESASHEYSMRLGTSVSGTLVNTASATADTPPDSQVPPTINTDPAGLEVANYTTVKSSDPASGAMVYPGQVVRYTVTVTQQGSAPAMASFSDDLTDVLDDAAYNADAKASLGTVAYRRGHVVWSGTIPVGGKATITYSVKVKKPKGQRNRHLANVVTSDGCHVTAGRTVGCATQHRTGRCDLGGAKGGNGSTEVMGGGRVRYALRVSNKGPRTSSSPIRVTDRLPRGLQLVSAYGRGWSCQVDTRADKATCVRATALAKGQKAPRIVVVAKATRAAIGRRLVNVARVGAVGDTVVANNRSTAAIRVVRGRALPHTGFRIAAPTWRWLA